MSDEIVSRVMKKHHEELMDGVEETIDDAIDAKLDNATLVDSICGLIEQKMEEASRLTITEMVKRQKEDFRKLRSRYDKSENKTRADEREKTLKSVLTFMEMASFGVEEYPAELEAWIKNELSSSADGTAKVGGSGVIKYGD